MSDSAISQGLGGGLAWNKYPTKDMVVTFSYYFQLCNGSENRMQVVAKSKWLLRYAMGMLHVAHFFRVVCLPKFLWLLTSCQEGVAGASHLFIYGRPENEWCDGPHWVE